MHEQTLMKQKDVKQKNGVKTNVWHMSLLRSGPVALRSSWDGEHGTQCQPKCKSRSGPVTFFRTNFWFCTFLLVSTVVRFKSLLVALAAHASCPNSKMPENGSTKSARRQIMNCPRPRANQQRFNRAASLKLHSSRSLPSHTFLTTLYSVEVIGRPLCQVGPIVMSLL